MNILITKEEELIKRDFSILYKHIGFWRKSGINIIMENVGLSKQFYFLLSSFFNKKNPDVIITIFESNKLLPIKLPGFAKNIVYYTRIKNSNTKIVRFVNKIIFKSLYKKSELLVEGDKLQDEINLLTKNKTFKLVEGYDLPKQTIRKDKLIFIYGRSKKEIIHLISMITRRDTAWKYIVSGFKNIIKKDEVQDLGLLNLKKVKTPEKYTNIMASVFLNRPKNFNKISKKLITTNSVIFIESNKNFGVDEAEIKIPKDKYLAAEMILKNLASEKLIAANTKKINKFVARNSWDSVFSNSLRFIESVK